MKIAFKPLEAADYPLAVEFKRRTFRDNTGSDDGFNRGFGADGTGALVMLAEFQALDPASCVLVLAEGVPIGLVLLAVRPTGIGHVNNYYLVPQWRGQRLGDQLDNYAMAFFRKHGCTTVELRTNPQGGSVGFYLRLGWLPGAIEANGLMRMQKAVAGAVSVG